MLLKAIIQQDSRFNTAQQPRLYTHVHLTSVCSSPRLVGTRCHVCTAAIGTCSAVDVLIQATFSLRYCVCCHVDECQQSLVCIAKKSCPVYKHICL